MLRVCCGCEAVGLEPSPFVLPGLLHEDVKPFDILLVSMHEGIVAYPKSDCTSDLMESASPEISCDPRV